MNFHWLVRNESGKHTVYFVWDVISDGGEAKPTKVSSKQNGESSALLKHVSFLIVSTTDEKRFPLTIANKTSVHFNQSTSFLPAFLAKTDPLDCHSKIKFSLVIDSYFSWRSESPHKSLNTWHLNKFLNWSHVIVFMNCMIQSQQTFSFFQ
jgi:hypothetical protein